MLFVLLFDLFGKINRTHKDSLAVYKLISTTGTVQKISQNTAGTETYYKPETQTVHCNSNQKRKLRSKQPPELK